MSVPHIRNENVGTSIATARRQRRDDPGTAGHRDRARRRRTTRRRDRFGVVGGLDSTLFLHCVQAKLRNSLVLRVHLGAQDGAAGRVKLVILPLRVREVIDGGPVLADEVGLHGRDVLEHFRRILLDLRCVLVELGRSRIEDSQIGVVDDQIGVEDLAIGIDLFDDRADRQVLILEWARQIPRRLASVGDVAVAPRLQTSAGGEEVEPLGFDDDRVRRPVLEGQDPVAQAAHGGVNKVLLMGLRIDEVLVLAAHRLHEGRGGGLQREVIRRQVLGDPRVVTGRQVAGEPR